MRIALLGGSFNPPHVGHAMNALFVLQTQQVERVWLMPCVEHAFGKRLAPFEARVAMCELAVRHLKGVEVTRIEAELPAGSRTIDVLDLLAARHPEERFCLVVGSDILSERHRWRSFDRIESEYGVIVVPRMGYAHPLSLGAALPEVSSSELREKLARGERVEGLVDSAVHDYLSARGLYSATASLP